MKIRQCLKFKLVALLSLAAFLANSFVFCLPARAELACWNDSSNTKATGGSNNLTSANPKASKKVADPVNVATGNFYHERTEFIIPSRSIPLEFMRYYNSQDDYDGPFGIGTSHSYNIFLIEAAGEEGSYVIRRNPDGNKDRFTKHTDGTYTAPAGVFDLLTKDVQGYLITDKHGIAYRFNAAGYLSSITDRNGNQVNLAYGNNAGVLIKITDSAGRDILLEYSAQRKISKITDFSGRAWNFAYANGDLISVTSPDTEELLSGGTFVYTYVDHNIVAIRDPVGNDYLGVTYDAQDRVDKLTAGSDVTGFEYASGLTTVYDAKGNRIDYVLNSDGTTAEEIEYLSGYNYSKKYEYNSDKLVTKVTYPRGNSLEYAYDGKGNLLTVKRHPLSGSSAADIVNTFTYEPKYNFVKTAADSLGNTVTYYYDYEEAALGDLNGDGVIDAAKGNLVKMSFPEVGGQVPESRFVYNNYGQVITATDPSGNLAKNEYDPSTGYLVKAIKAGGVFDITAEMTYDTVGNVTAVKDPKGNTTVFEYDSHNNLVKVVSPEPFNYVTRNKYDANDNLIQVDRQTGDSNNPWQITYYVYDVLDRLLTVKDGLGNVTTFGYDASGNRSLVQDAELNSTVSEYDERNRLWKVTDAVGNLTEYTYDANGNLQIIKDAKGNSTTYSYDDFDRLIKTTYADNSYEEYTYDANTNLKTEKDPKGQTIYYEYDALRRLTEKGLSPQGTVPASVVNYVYDLSSRLKQVTDANGIIAYDYDAANRVNKVTYPGAQSVSYAYDNNSQRTKLIYPDSTYITYEYDQLNRLTAIKDQNNQGVISYAYDALSRRTKGALANGAEAVYAYDDANRLLQSINRQSAAPENKLSRFDYAYDKVGNRKTTTTLGGAHQYTYDKIYQLTAVAYPSGYFAADSTFNYDQLGSRDNVISGSVTSYTTNSLNQYTQVGGTAYTNDTNGNLVNDGIWTYTYDYENRLTQAVKAGTTAIYKYDPLGRRIEKNVNGAITKFLYDGDQIIAEYDSSGVITKKYAFGPGIDEPLRVIARSAGDEAIYYYHFDGLGSVSNLTDSSGAIVESYSYDVFGKPSAASTIGNRFMFTGREYDAETGLYYYRARYYSPGLGRFLQRDPIGYRDSFNLYQYCRNNPINSLDPLGLWVAIGEKSIGPGSHTVIILHPDNQSDFKNNKNIPWYKDKNGELEATLSANPDWKPNLDSLYGNLVAYPSNKSDRPSNLRNMQRISDPSKRSDTQLIKDLINSASTYRNNLPYDPIPCVEDPSVPQLYNSNSYTRGVFNDAGIPNPPNLPGAQPGWDIPIPL